MGKNKTIRKLELEVERLRKNVIDLERVIDRLLSDTITDSEKKVIKLDRHFAKATASVFDKYLLSGKTPDYRPVSKVCDFLDNLKKNPNLVPGEGSINPDDTVHCVSTKYGRQYRHTEKADNYFKESTDEIKKGPQDEYLRGYTAALDTINKDVEKGYLLIHAPVGSFIVPPTDNKIINEHLSVIQEELQRDMDNTIILKDVNVCGHNVGDVTFQKSELLDGGQNNQGSVFITNHIEQEFRLKNHKDILTYNDKYIFLSDYHISSPYINEDIVIKQGEILSLVERGSYGTSETCLVKFTYQNIKLMEEKGLVRRLSPLDMCVEHQVCAPAKEETNSPAECKTSEKWLAEIPSEYKVRITVPSGWDRSNFEYSFKAECISKNEFIKRLQSSTIICHVRFWASDWANK